MDPITFFIMFVVFFVLSQVLAPKPQSELGRPPSLGDFNFPTATAGRVIPLVWGTIEINGPNIVWYGDLTIQDFNSRVRRNLFQTVSVTTAYQYLIGMQFALCLGPVDSLNFIQIGADFVFSGQLTATNDTVTIDLPNLYGGSKGIGNGGVGGDITFYPGSSTQTPDPYLGTAEPTYLWFDDYSQGEDNAPLLNFQGTDNGVYYFVSSVAQGSRPFPGPSEFNPDGSDLGRGFVTLDNSGFAPDQNSTTIKLRSRYVSNVGNPDYELDVGDTNMYVALLQHPNRPRLNDNIAMTVILFPKDTTANDGSPNAHRIQFGCKMQDQGNELGLNGQGVWVSINDALGLEVGFTSSTGSTSFGVVSGFDIGGTEATIKLTVVGTLISVYINGSLIVAYENADIVNIDNNNKGFTIAVDGNLNVDFLGVVDWSDVGVYSIGIDDLNVVHAENNQPAYRGCCYVTAGNGTTGQGFYVGNSTSVAPWSFEVTRIPNGLSLTDNMHIVNGKDCNPMNVIYEVITNTEWGLGQSPSLIDITNFTDSAVTLFNEGNGWSAVIDTPISADDFLAEIERQTAGFIFVNRNTGLWTIKLVRPDYVLDDVPEINEGNTIEVKSFTNGAWEDTINQVMIQFSCRANIYNDAFGVAQDIANVMIQQGVVKSVTSRYPGIKDQDLANQIAWRDLRDVCVPSAKCNITVDRTFYDINPGDPVSFTNSSIGVFNLPMRVIRVDLGPSSDTTIILDLVKDVFDPYGTDTASYAAPPNSGFVNPITQLAIPIPVGDSLIFEAPWKFDELAAVSPGVGNRVFATSRNPGSGAYSAEIWSENTDDGDGFAQSGNLVTFCVRAKLEAAILYPIDPIGTDSFTVILDVDAISYILGQIQPTTNGEIGTQLINLVLIDQELMAFKTFTTDGSTYITLNNVYRGMCDTAPALHNIDTFVWFLTTGGNVTDISYGQSDDLAFALLPTTAQGTMPITIAPVVDLTMQSRSESPYPPIDLEINSSPYPTSATFDTIPIGFESDAAFLATGVSNLASPGGSTGEVSGSVAGMAFTISQNELLVGVRFYKPDTTGLGLAAVNFSAAVYRFNGTIGDWSNVTFLYTSANADVYTDPPGGSAAGWISVPTGPFSLSTGINYGILVAATLQTGSFVYSDDFFTGTTSAFFTLSTQTYGSVTVPQEGGYLSIKTNVLTVSDGIPNWSTYSPTSTIIGNSSTGTEFNYFVDPLFGSGAAIGNIKGIPLSYTRRDFRNQNEVKAMRDETTLPGDFPTANATQYFINVYYGDGVSIPLSLLYTTNPNSGGNSWFLKRNDIIGAYQGIPSVITIQVGTLHTFTDGFQYFAQQYLQASPSLTTELSSYDFLGTLETLTPGNSITAPHTTTYTVQIGSALAAGAVQVSVNGGSYTTVIAATMLTGTFTATNGQSLVFQHTQGFIDGTTNIYLDVVDGSTHDVFAYGIVNY